MERFFGKWAGLGLNTFAAEIENSSVYAAFRRSVIRVPDAVAVVTNDTTHTYADLVARSDAIRNHLHACGVRSGDLVALLLNRDMELPAAIMAVFGLSAAYMPLEAGDPVERNLRALKTCRCRAVLCARSNLNTLREAMLETGFSPVPDFIEVDDIMPLSGEPPIPRLPSPETLAYVLLTSGSTGQPKAVNVTHENVQNHIVSALEVLKFTENDRYLATTPLTFDPSISEIFLPLAAGGTTVVRDRNLILDPKRLCAEMKESGVTVAAATPSTWATVTKAAGNDFPHLRAIITHGEAISPTFARVLASKAEMAMNLYGPTEATVWATGYQLREDAPENASKTSAPIGMPLKNFVIRVLDPAGNDVDTDVPGELILGGPSVAMGYRNDPDRTAKVFFEEGGIRYYRTGDLVHRRADGVIEYMGRVDDQMAINGQRIEPGEIEAAILSHPWVKTCGVTWYPQPNDQRGIVAAIVSEEGQSVTADGMRMYLATKLSRAMLPGRYLILDALPHLTSGKVDRNALRAMLEDGPPAPVAEATDRAMTETETRLAAIWNDLLRITDTQPDDDFFLIGGDSLSAVEMAMNAEAEFGITMDITEVFEAPKLRDCAARIDAQTSASGQSTESSPNIIEVKSNSDELPLYFVMADYGYAGRAGAKLTCPFYNLTVWNRDEGIVRNISIEDMAARYMADIRARQPHGPYRLAGYSIGGILAFELARQLVAAGEEIACLFLLDPTPPTKLEPEDGKRITDGTGASRLRRLIRRAPRQILNLTYWRSFVKVNRALRTTGTHASRDINNDQRRRALIFATGRVAARYVARPLDVPTTLVSSDTEMLTTWPRLLGPNTETRTITGNHRGMFRPPVDEVWTGYLIEALAKDGT